MSHVDNVAQLIMHALSALDDMQSSREVSIAKTKLQESLMWLGATVEALESMEIAANEDDEPETPPDQIFILDQHHLRCVMADMKAHGAEVALVNLLARLAINNGG